MQQAEEQDLFPKYIAWAAGAHAVCILLYFFFPARSMQVLYHSSEIEITPYTPSRRIEKKQSQDAAVRAPAEKNTPPPPPASPRALRPQSPRASSEISETAPYIPIENRIPSRDIQSAPAQKIQASSSSDTAVPEGGINPNQSRVDRGIQHRAASDQGKQDQKNTSQTEDGLGSSIRFVKNSAPRVCVFRPAFHMPEEFKNKGINAKVICEFAVDGAGNVVSAEITVSSGYGALDRAVREYLRGHRFSRDSVNRTSFGQYDVSFKN